MSFQSLWVLLLGPVIYKETFCFLKYLAGIIQFHVLEFEKIICKKSALQIACNLSRGINMHIIYTVLEGLLIFEPKIFVDNRGSLTETWNKQRYAEAGLEVDFVQDNISFSFKDVLRGLHLQSPQGQGKLVQVLFGEIMDVAVDLRNGSPTFGKHFKIILSEHNRKQIYIPAGFAHGFCVLWSDPELCTTLD